jgi:hypothetical protein
MDEPKNQSNHFGGEKNPLLLDVPKSQSNHFGGEKNPLLLPGIEPRFLVQGCSCVTVLLVIL